MPGEGIGAGANLRLRKQLRDALEHLKAGDLDAARSGFADVIENNPETSAAHLGLGRVYLQEEDLQAALQCFQEALACDPKSSLARIMIARVHEKLGELDAAMEDYEEASELDPSRGIAQRRISRIFAQNDDYAEAVARLRGALERNPQQVPTRFMLANMLERAGDTAAAKSELQRVLELKPDMWIAAYKLGRLHLRDEEASAARPVLEEAVRLAPDKAAPRLALGAVLKGLGDQEQALAVLREAQKLNSKNPSTITMMIADCQIKLGQPEEALKSLRQALRRGRRPGVLHKRLGDVLMTLERHREAIEEYRAAFLHQPQLAEQQPALRALMEKAQSPGEDLEQLAKQIQTTMASISATKRAALKGESQVMDDNLGTPAIRRPVGVQRFGRLRRQRGTK